VVARFYYSSSSKGQRRKEGPERRKLKKREKGSGRRGEKKWNLFKLSCACGQEEGNGPEERVWAGGFEKRGEIAIDFRHPINPLVAACICCSKKFDSD
jgi:hypothetical protein